MILPNMTFPEIIQRVKKDYYVSSDIISDRMYTKYGRLIRKFPKQRINLPDYHFKSKQGIHYVMYPYILNGNVYTATECRVPVDKGVFHYSLSKINKRLVISCYTPHFFQRVKERSFPHLTIAELVSRLFRNNEVGSVVKKEDLCYVPVFTGYGLAVEYDGGYLIKTYIDKDMRFSEQQGVTEAADILHELGNLSTGEDRELLTQYFS